MLFPVEKKATKLSNSEVELDLNEVSNFCNSAVLDSCEFKSKKIAAELKNQSSKCLRYIVIISFTVLKNKAASFYIV